ncbi:MAG: YveK family protein [Caulobacteraceae bacterium]
METIELRKMFGIIRKRLLLITILIFGAVITTCVLSYFVFDKQYEATTTLILDRLDDYGPDPQLQHSNIILYQKLFKTYGEIAKSRMVTEKVIELMQLNLNAEQLQKKITVTPVGDTELIRVTVVDTNPDMAADIANKLAEVFKYQVAQIMRVENVQVVDAANVPISPVNPRPVLNVAIAFLIALMTGVGVAFLLEYLDHTIKTPQDVEKYLELPVLGVIPDVKT